MSRHPSGEFPRVIREDDVSGPTLTRVASVLGICLAAMTLLGGAGTAATVLYRVTESEKREVKVDAGPRLQRLEDNYPHIKEQLRKIEEKLDTLLIVREPKP